MTKQKVGTASYEDMKADTLAVATGALKPEASDPKVWVTSPESFAKLHSNRHCVLRLADMTDAQIQEMLEAEIPEEFCYRLSDIPDGE